MLDRFTYWIADLLFTKHLEADYQMGLNEGARVTYMVMASQLTRLKADAPKYAQAGLDLAIQEIEKRIH